AAHAPLAEVHVGHEALVLAQELVAHAAAVAGGAVARHRGGAVEVVPVDEAAADALRLADVALAAGGVAASAMVVERFAQRFVPFGGAAGIEDRPVAGEGAVQAVLGHGYGVRVAVATILLGVGARIRQQAVVRGLFVGGLLAPVTLRAGDGAVHGARVGRAVYEYFFPGLQRSHRTASALPFVFADDLILGGSRANEHLFVGVAAQTFVHALTFRGGLLGEDSCFRWRGGQGFLVYEGHFGRGRGAGLGLLFAAAGQPEQAEKQEDGGQGFAGGDETHNSLLRKGIREEIHYQYKGSLGKINGKGGFCL